MTLVFNISYDNLQRKSVFLHSRIYFSTPKYFQGLIKMSFLRHKTIWNKWNPKEPACFTEPHCIFMGPKAVLAEGCFLCRGGVQPTTVFLGLYLRNVSPMLAKGQRVLYRGWVAACFFTAALTNNFLSIVVTLWVLENSQFNFRRKVASHREKTSLRTSVCFVCILLDYRLYSLLFLTPLHTTIFGRKVTCAWGYKHVLVAWRPHCQLSWSLLLVWIAIPLVSSQGE